MNRSIIHPSLLCVALCLSGCGTATDDLAASRAGDTGSVAVIDLDEVARRVGLDVQMSNSVQQRTDALNDQITNVRVSFEKQLAAKQNELGDETTEQQKNEITQLERQMNVKLAQLKREAETNLNQHRGELINAFRAETKKVAKAVAKTKGITLIVTTNDTVIFSYESALDITDQVVDQFETAASPSLADTGQPAARTAARASNIGNTK